MRREPYTHSVQGPLAVRYAHRNGEATPPTIEGYYWVDAEDGDYERHTIIAWYSMVAWSVGDNGVLGWGSTAGTPEGWDVPPDTHIYGPIPQPPKPEVPHG